MQAGIFGAPAQHHAGGELRRNERASDDALVVADAPAAGREYEPEFAPRTGQLPGPQGVDHEGTERDGALAGARLRLADGEVAIGALAHAELALLQVDVIPGEAAQLTGAQPGE